MLCLDGLITRSYTPVPPSFFPKEIEFNETDLLFLIKAYEEGKMTQWLINDCTDVQVSNSKGDFNLQKLKMHSHFAMLAAGSGITPMLSIMKYLLSRKTNKVFVEFNL